jgi:PAS domain S-box-containing protein
MMEENQLPYDYKMADSVAQAHRILETEKFDLILCDFQLSDGTGFEILNCVRDTPVIMVTGIGSETTAVKAWRAGAYDYLTKDLDRSYLQTMPITLENAIRRKQMEDQLHLLSGAITCTSDAVYITDTENKIIFVNRAFCEIYGYAKGDVLGKDANVLWVGRPEHHGSRCVFQISGNSRQMGFCHKKKNGAIFPVSLSRAIIKDARARNMAVVSIARDISGQVTAEEELKALNHKLKEQDEQITHQSADACEKLSLSMAQLRNIVSDMLCSDNKQIEAHLRTGLQEIDALVGQTADAINLLEKICCSAQICEK